MAAQKEGVEAASEVLTLPILQGYHHSWHTEVCSIGQLLLECLQRAGQKRSKESYVMYKLADLNTTQ